MTETTPEIHCVDYWPNGLREPQISAYKAMIAAGQITKRTAVASRSTGAVIIEYLSTVPQEWIREEMRRISERKGK